MFWTSLIQHEDATALIDASTGASWTYRELAQSISGISKRLPNQRRMLIALPLNNRVSEIIQYLGVLTSDNVVMPYNDHTPPKVMAALVSRYRPDVILGWAALSRTDGYHVDLAWPDGQAIRTSGSHTSLHPVLKLLLPTSGSTGSPKMVRLSATNIHSNAVQISIAQRIQKTDIAITSLPISYIYGLSVLHSHLNSGAAIVVDGSPGAGPKRINILQDHRVTTLPGVPWAFRLMQYSKLDAGQLPSLKKITSSGDKLHKDTADWLLELSYKFGIHIFSMYGQTEACGRMSVLPAEDFALAPGSVGQPVPGGRIEIDQSGQIIYYGPNVMLGYAECIQDLVKGDELQGRLETGDQGHITADGNLFLSGRLSRYAKVYGVRVCLDEIPTLLSGGLDVVADSSPGSDQILLYHTAAEGKRLGGELAGLARLLKIPRASLQMQKVEQIARKSNGKPDINNIRRYQVRTFS